MIKNRVIGMNLVDFLTDCSTEELTERLMMFDKSIMELHQNGFFVVGDFTNIQIYDNQITLASFNNKIDYLNSGYNVNGDKKDILELCAIGICAYNNFKTFYTNKEFLSYLMENLDMFINNGNIPPTMVEYYQNVFSNGNIDYLTRYIVGNEGRKSSKSYTKATAIGRALSDKDDAYVNVLIIPSLMVFGYLVFLLFYFFLAR